MTLRNWIAVSAFLRRAPKFKHKTESKGGDNARLLDPELLNYEEELVLLSPDKVKGDDG